MSKRGTRRPKFSSLRRTSRRPYLRRSSATLRGVSRICIDRFPGDEGAAAPESLNFERRPHLAVNLDVVPHIEFRMKLKESDWGSAAAVQFRLIVLCCTLALLSLVDFPTNHFRVDAISFNGGLAVLIAF